MKCVREFRGRGPLRIYPVEPRGSRKAAVTTG